MVATADRVRLGRFTRDTWKKVRRESSYARRGELAPEARLDERVIEPVTKSTDAGVASSCAEPSDWSAPVARAARGGVGSDVGRRPQAGRHPESHAA
jgi:hypothetical protein